MVRKRLFIWLAILFLLIVAGGYGLYRAGFIKIIPGLSSE